MNTVERTSKEFFKELRILHLALLVGQLLIAGILYYITTGEKKKMDFDSGDISSYFVPSVIVVGFMASSFIFKKLVVKAKSMDNLKDKLGAYRSASIVKWALLEGPALIGIILFFISNNLTFLIMGVAMIVYFATTGSSIEKTIEDLSLNHDEQKAVRRPDEIVARIKSAL